MEVAGEAGATLFRATFKLNGQVLVVSDHDSDIAAALAWDLYYRALVSGDSGTVLRTVLGMQTCKRPVRCMASDAGRKACAPFADSVGQQSHAAPVAQAPPWVVEGKTNFGEVPSDSRRRQLTLQKRAAALLYAYWKPTPPSLQAARNAMAAVVAATEPKVGLSARPFRQDPHQHRPVVGQHLVHVGCCSITSNQVIATSASSLGANQRISHPTIASMSKVPLHDV